MSTPPPWPPPPPATPPPPQPPPPAQPPEFAGPLPPGVPGAPPPYGQAPPKKPSSAMLIVILLIIVVFGGIAVLGIVAAIAIPAFMRARSGANEAMAIGRMRTMVSAQMTWASLHDGTFTTPSCLSVPASCGDTTGDAVLPADVASLASRGGYDYGFALRPPPEQPTNDDQAGVGGFAYWATPSRPGVTGRRTFCVGETGVILVYPSPEAWLPPAEGEGRCPAGGRPHE